MHHTPRRPLAAVTFALLLVACSDPGSSLETVAPTTTLPVGSTTTATTVAATDPATTEATTTVATTEPTTATTLALTDGPWTVVATIPEVAEPGLYYELSLPGLYAYFPTKVSPDDQVFWTMNDADRPVIEAYLNAQLTINQAMLTRPMDFALDGWNQYFADGGAEYQEALRPLSDAGQAMDLDPGYVMRPWVIDDGRTETTATVIDCQIIGAVMRNADGALAAGSSEGWGRHGRAATLVLRDGAWVVTGISDLEEACTVFGPDGA